MKHLPVEILDQIFILLHQRDKIECMTVCRRWEEAIISYSLLHTVRLSSMESLEKLITKVQKEPSIGYQVVRLILNLYIDNSDFDVGILPLIFPNVRVFHLSGSCYSKAKKKRLLFSPWHKQIEYFFEEDGIKLFDQLLNSGPCMFLTKITLVGIESYLGSDYLSLLIHAPSLKELTTFAIDFSFEDLELLHATLPRLCSVRFDSLELRNSKFPENVQPALGITSFAVTGYTVVRMETEQKLFKYIGKKYPNLCDLAYDADNLVIRDDADEECVYKEGWLPLMKSLGPQLKRLSINPEHDIEDLLKVLDGCQIDEFNLRYQTDQMALEKLGKSNPAKYFKSLKLYGVQCLRFGWLRNMSMLTELYVHYGRNPKGDSIIQLNDVVNACGDRLESLKLSYVDIKFDDLLTHDAVYPIKRLELEMVHLPPDIDAYISYSFPSLRILKFNKCKLSGRHLILPNIHLYYLEIRESLPNNDGGVLVKTIKDNQKRFHSVRHNIYECTSFERDFAFQDVATYPSIVSSPFDKNQPQHIPFLTLVCHSLQTLFILNDSY